MDAYAGYLWNRCQDASGICRNMSMGFIGSPTQGILSVFREWIGLKNNMCETAREWL